MNTEKSTRRADTARLAPRELRTLRKYPNLLREARHLIKACKTVMRQVEALHDYLAHCVAGDIPPGPWDSWLERERDEVNIERAAMLAAGESPTTMPPSMLRMIGLG